MNENIAPEITDEEFSDNVRDILEAQQGETDSDHYDEDLPDLPIVNEELEQKIMDAYRKVNEIKENRKELNAENQEIRAGLNAKFLDKKGWDIVMKLINLTDEERAKVDFTVNIVRRVLNIPQQEQLDL